MKKLNDIQVKFIIVFIIALIIGTAIYVFYNIKNPVDLL